LSNATGLSFFMHYDFPWNGHVMESLLPFAGTSAVSFKVLKTDTKLTKYVMRGTYDFKCKYIVLSMIIHIQVPTLIVYLCFQHHY
jgi:hypothetical protein